MATLIVRMTMGVAFGQRPLLILFLLPIMLSAYMGGLGPGLISTLLAVVGVKYFLIPPTHTFYFAKAADLVQWIVLVVNGLFISGLSEALHRARREAENRTHDFLAANLELRQEIAERKRAEEGQERKGKHVEEQLRELAHRQEILLSEIPDIVMEVDTRKVYTWANPAGYAFFGDDVIGKEAAEYFVGEQDTYTKVQPLFSGDSSLFYVESWQRRKDGENRLLAWWCKTLKDSEGRVTGALSTARDITDLRSSQEALRESEERWQFALEGAGDGVWDWNARTNKAFFSRQWKSMLGFQEHEIGDMQDEWDRRVHPDDRKRVYVEIKRHFEGKAPFYISEHRVKCKDGTYKWILARGKVMSRTPEGKPLRVIGTHTDITDRKQAEEVLREAEERFRLLFEISTDALLIRDREGIIRLANPAAVKVLKASGLDKIIGKAYLDFIHPEDRPGSIDRIQKLIKAVQGEPGIDPADLMAPLREHRMLTFDGETIWVESTGTAFRHQGQVWVQGLFHDVTKRKQAEEALHKSEKVARRRAKENAIVAEIGRIISSTLDIENIYERFAEEARELITFDHIVITTINQEKGTLHIAYVSGYVIQGRGRGDEISLEGSFSEEAARSRSIQLIQTEDAEEVAARFPKLLPFWQHGFRSFMAIPLISNDQVVGVLCFYSMRSRAYKEADANLAEQIAAQIAGAIANAQLFAERRRAEEALGKREEEARKLANENAIVAKIGRIISSTFSIEEVYKLFAEEVKNFLSFDRIIINMIDADKKSVVNSYVEGIPAPGREQGEVFSIRGTLVEAVMQAEKGLIIGFEDEDEVRGKFPGLLPEFRAGFRSFLSVPLISRHQVVGGLHLRSRKYKAYAEEDLRLAECVANQIAGAVANAQLFLERKRAEEQLKASLKEKEVLLREIHHRVKNNLQVISSLLRLQSRYIGDDAISRYFKESQDRVRTMAIIHEKLYQSTDLARVDFAEYVKDLTANLYRSYGVNREAIDLTVHVNNLYLDVDTANPCGLIINELVSNSLKYAFPGGERGEIFIDLRSDHDQIILTVGDSGGAFPKGLDFRKTESLGLQLVISLVEQLEGTIELHSDGKTEFRIAFPARYPKVGA